MSHKPIDRALLEHIFASELRTIRMRREAAKLAAPDPVEGDRPCVPCVQRGLVGVALSGGGIGSSTFSIGVLQALAAAGVFRRADYVSTVSGVATH